MRRQKKFYAWGYADEDLTPDEIAPWEAEIAERYGLNGPISSGVRSSSA